MRFSHLPRYKEVALFFYHCFQSGWELRGGEKEFLSGISDDQDTSSPDALVEELEKLGPTYVKFGQLLSTRSDLLPPEYIEALSRLQDSVSAFPYEDAVAIIERELDENFEDIFKEFHAIPLGSGSLGQVHQATLHDGTSVVVKVQRPKIRKQIEEDLEILDEVTAAFQKYTRLGKRYELHQVFRQFRRALIEELDFRVEADNLKTIGKNLKEFDKIVVPKVFTEFSTERVLTMHEVGGCPLASIEEEQTHRQFADLATQLVQAYIKQILVDGFFHADPHPGNMLLMRDGKLGLFDFGMAIRIDDGLKEQLLQLLIAMAEGHGERTADVITKMGFISPEFDEFTFRNRINEIVSSQQQTSIEEQEVGSTFLGITEVCAQCGVRLLPELSSIGRALLHLDAVGRILYPEINPTKVVKDYAAQVVKMRLLDSISPNKMLNEMLEAKDFIVKMPSRINSLLENLTSSKFSLNIDAIDEAYLMKGFQKVANRITMGLILASLIIGAALMMRIETPFTVFGYPGIAILCFLFAAASGVFLMASIVLSDSRSARSGNKKNNF